MRDFIKILIIIVTMILAISCNRSSLIECKESKGEISYDRNSSETKIDSLISLALLNGDKQAYSDAFGYYFRGQKIENFLLSSIVMANHYNDSNACFNVYLILSDTEQTGVKNNRDSLTHSLSFYYLLKAYELKDENAKNEVDEVFKGRKIPASASYLVKMTKFK